MGRRSTRIRIGSDGSLEVVDPGLDTLKVLQQVDPDFTILTSELPAFFSPRLLRTRTSGTGLRLDALPLLTEKLLWETHAASLPQSLAQETIPCAEGEASLLDMKIELAERILSHCQLCAHRCGVDRTRGEMGICRLGAGATMAEHFVHIAEESPINPSLVLNLAGCGLRCRFCQQGWLLDPEAVRGEELEPGLWAQLRTSGASSLSFVGGNPDESLPAILRFLAAAPEAWALPIVWNNHAYTTPETLLLLNEIVDAYVPDLKYGSATCGKELSGIEGYPEVARAAILTMLQQGVPVIVRILVLPEHVECCHLPSLHFLSQLTTTGILLVSIRDQYCPDWQITSQDGSLARRPTVEEVATVLEVARSLGLYVVS